MIFRKYQNWWDLLQRYIFQAVSKSIWEFLPEITERSTRRKHNYEQHKKTGPE